ncbi:MAG: VOC family protein [Propionibacteriaceae bacterium]|jgi:predicted enzyme related to lactoylglutathione lyase|nr:VOC family protein [Propionibacteriaceae bacterium]
MTPFIPNEIILYSGDVPRSTAFWEKVLGVTATETFGDDFSFFAFDGGFMLGIQNKDEISPAPQPAWGGFEICLADTDNETVNRLYTEWKEAGIELLDEPADQGFGYTFVAVDPDGHRLRVCATDPSAG